jgi:hypothetical protein
VLLQSECSTQEITEATGVEKKRFSQKLCCAKKSFATQVVQAFAESQNGNSGYYIPVQGTALNNWKLKAFAGGGTEITAGAYPASFTTDVEQLSITARKSNRRVIRCSQRAGESPAAASEAPGGP